MWAKLNSARDAVEEIIFNTKSIIIDNISSSVYPLINNNWHTPRYRILHRR